MRRLGSLALAVLALGGCIEELDPATLIARPRVLGARVEPADDATRAWPLAGETARVRWLVAQPGEPAPVAWAFLACAAVVTPTGETFCGGDPIAFAQQAEPVMEAPAVEVPVPAGFAADEVLVLGVVCAGSAPRLDLEAREIGCEPGGSEEKVQVTIPVWDGEGEPNHHPVIPDDALTLSGAPWPAATGVPLEGCDGASVTRLDAGTDEVTIGLSIPDGEREATEEAGSEELLVSHFVTAGEIARQFSLIDDASPAVEVDFTAPPAEDLPPGGRRVDLHVVVRDQRGGVAWTSRPLCVVP